MKKLMIAAAIVCAAAISQAAVVEWGLGSAASIKIGDTTTKLGNQAIQLYLVGMNDANDMLFDSKSTLNSPSNKKGTMAQSAGDTQKGSGIDYRSTAAGGAFWDSETGDLGREYYIKLTTTQGGVTYTYESSAIASSGLSDTALGKVSFDINSAVTDVAGTKDMWVAQSVPEPTSGLLLLLGVAGLALRRRRA